MKLSISLILSLCTLSQAVVPRFMHGRPASGFVPPPPLEFPVEALPKDQYFKNQRLDHFDHENTAVWAQRYFVNSTFHKKGGPIFLMLGGEGPASPVWNVAGAWQMYAKKLNAITIQLEHRFYGKSHPVR